MGQNDTPKTWIPIKDVVDSICDILPKDCDTAKYYADSLQLDKDSVIIFSALGLYTAYVPFTIPSTHDTMPTQDLLLQYNRLRNSRNNVDRARQTIRADVLADVIRFVSDMFSWAGPHKKHHMAEVASYLKDVAATAAEALSHAKPIDMLTAGDFCNSHTQTAGCCSGHSLLFSSIHAAKTSIQQIKEINYKTPIDMQKSAQGGYMPVFPSGAKYPLLLEDLDLSYWAALSNTAIDDVLDRLNDTCISFERARNEILPQMERLALSPTTVQNLEIDVQSCWPY